MALLDCGNHAELRCELLKALFFRRLGELDIHVVPLVVLALCRVEEVGRRVSDAVQLLEPHLCMRILVRCGLLKESADLLKTFLLRRGSEVQILGSRHRLAGISLLQVLLGLGACVLGLYIVAACDLLLVCHVILL